MAAMIGRLQRLLVSEAPGSPMTGLGVAALWVAATAPRSSLLGRAELGLEVANDLEEVEALPHAPANPFLDLRENTHSL